MLYIYENQIDIRGEWDSNYGELTFYQLGNKVLGKFTFFEGVLEGTLNGNVLTGTWMSKQSLGRCPYGSLEFIFSGDTVKGTWTYCYNGDPADTMLIGFRKKD